MNKHTPGPWRIAVDSWGRTEIESDNPRDNAEEGVVYVLASSIGGRVHGESYDDFSEVEANVKLISAAPDLLEALTNFRAAFVLAVGDQSPYAKCALSEVDTAIAKATQ